jgi:ribosomal protein S18 acetylase RimI-like enzyme
VSLDEALTSKTASISANRSEEAGDIDPPESCPMGWEVRPAQPSEWLSALQVLFESYPMAERPALVQEALQANDAGRCPLTGLMVLRQHDRLLAACLMLPQPDGITLVWPPGVAEFVTARDAAHAALLHEVLRQISARGDSAGQMLYDPEIVREASAWERLGFRHVIELQFLAVSLDSDPAPSGNGTTAERVPPPAENTQPLPLSQPGLSDGDRTAPTTPHRQSNDIAIRSGEQPTRSDEWRAGRPNWQVIPYSNDPAVHHRFVETLEATYVDSADCPVLGRLRTGEQALQTHQQAGVWNGANWGLFEYQARDVGLVLLADHPDHDAVELVYLGILPEWRGRGAGRGLLTWAMDRARSLGRSVLFVAVDVANLAATRLYTRSGFQSVGQRRARLWIAPGLAQQ